MNAIVILCDTLRRDHCGAYHHGRPLNQCWSDQQPGWVVPTPNMDRLAARGTVFDQAWCGSTPCMPARRDLYTGRHEFLERGWGPLEDDDLDLPRQISGASNRSIKTVLEGGDNISYLVTDHFHLWEHGAGNYHMGYTGFDFVRGIESDAYHTAPREGFFCPPGDEDRKIERHWRNVSHLRSTEADYFPAQVFQRAADWVERNQDFDDFYLHIDCFGPHEPWDPPEQLLKQFWPDGYNVDFDWTSSATYAPWEGQYTQTQMNFLRARYAASVVLVDRWLGVLLDKLDELNLRDDTMIIFTTDHGTYNGDHGRMGKLQTHEHDAVGHIPLIVSHPTAGHGQRRDQLVQLVDIFPTVLSALGKPPADHPRGLHGVDLLPVVLDPAAPTRDLAVCGQFGMSVSVTDGRWILHQAPADPSARGNQPLNWYSHHRSFFIHTETGDFVDGHRPALDVACWNTPTWLSDKDADPNELTNLAGQMPEQVRVMQKKLVAKLAELGAPPEQLQRLGLHGPATLS